MSVVGVNDSRLVTYTILKPLDRDITVLAVDCVS